MKRSLTVHRQHGKAKSRVIVHHGHQSGGLKKDSITVEQTTVANYQMSPEIMQILKISLESHLRSNPEVMKEALANLCQAQPGFLRELLDQSHFYSTDEPAARVLSKQEAKEKIGQYIREHPGCRTSDIIENLNVEVSQALEILKELKSEGSVQSKPLEQQ